jgi:hypothetical protein
VTATDLIARRDGQRDCFLVTSAQGRAIPSATTGSLVRMLSLAITTCGSQTRDWRRAGAPTTTTREVLRSSLGTRAGRWSARCTSLGASALAPLRSSPRALQPLLLDKVHNRHDRGRLRQLDAELLHDRPEVRQELIESLLALPDIEDL